MGVLADEYVPCLLQSQRGAAKVSHFAHRLTMCGKQENWVLAVQGLIRG